MLLQKALIMKLNQLIVVGATSFLTSVISVAGYAAAVTVNLSSNAVSPTASLTISNTAVAQNRSVAITSGTFVAAEKPTSQNSSDCHRKWATLLGA